MGKLPRRSHLPAEEVDALKEECSSRAKRRCINLIRDALDSHFVDGQEVDQFVGKVSEALQLQSVPPLDRISFSTKFPPPDSNSSCEVCERGGDLVCCDLCPLVFHQRCIRPALTTLPKGAWICAYCQLERGNRQEREEAKQAIYQMSLLTRGYHSVQLDPPSATVAHAIDSSSDHHSPAPTTHAAAPVLPPACMLRVVRTGCATVVHVGKKYVVRRTTRKQIKEHSKYATLSEALRSLPHLRSLSQVSRDQGSKMSTRKGSNTGEGVEIEGRAAHGMCEFCLSDRSVEMCVFCGCRECGGTFDAQNLHKCSECQASIHSYCLPSNASIPQGQDSLWTCPHCAPAATAAAASSISPALADPKTAHATSSNATTSHQTHPVASAPPAPTRGRGRPPGSGVKAKPQDPTPRTPRTAVRMVPPAPTPSPPPPAHPTPLHTFAQLLAYLQQIGAEGPESEGKWLRGEVLSALHYWKVWATPKQGAQMLAALQGAFQRIHATISAMEDEKVTGKANSGLGARNVTGDGGNGGIYGDEEDGEGEGAEGEFDRLVKLTTVHSFSHDEGDLTAGGLELDAHDLLHSPAQENALDDSHNYLPLPLVHTSSSPLLCFEDEGEDLL